MAALFGALGLALPSVVLDTMGLASIPANQRSEFDYTRVFVAASSMASLNMGVYYVVAAATEWRPFFRFTVPFRLLTFTVFTALVVTEVAPYGFIGVALWEAAGAVATALALFYDTRRPAPVSSSEAAR
ncbi:hypothetical protein ACQP2E_30655 [Actinoplanes sp. CA-015351]|uniref:hypothetical protein n=1 Tax=Actinoplanes sp. CA-015351 TaxID=3239897 RepID=UPI003D9961DD